MRIDNLLIYSYWREMYLKKNKCYPQITEDYEYPDVDNFHHLKDSKCRKQPKVNYISNYFFKHWKIQFNSI